MALQKQKFSISFNQGEDTKTDDKQVLPGKLIALENGILTKTGKVIKRNGYGVLGNRLASGAAITTYQDELIAFDGVDAFSYSKNTNKFINKGQLNTLKIESNDIIQDPKRYGLIDSVIHPSGLEVLTYSDETYVTYYTLVDTNTGQVLLKNELVDSGSSFNFKAKPLVLGNYVVILYVDDDTGTLKVLPIPVLDPMNPLPAFQISVAFEVTTYNYDACSNGERVFFTYNSSTGGRSIKLAYLTRTLGLSSALTISSQNADRCITIFSDSNNGDVYVAFVNAANAVKYFSYNYELTMNYRSPTTIETVAGIYNIVGGIYLTEGAVYYTISDGSTMQKNFIRSCEISQTAVTGTPAVFVRSVSILSKVFYYNGIRYFTSMFDTQFQSTYFVLNENAVVVAKFAPGLAGFTPWFPLFGSYTTMVSNSSSIDDFSFLFTHQRIGDVNVVAGVLDYPIGVSSTFIEFTSDNSFNEVELGNNLHVSGGLIQMYDGVGFVEHNFNYYPEGITNSINASTGGITAGTRQYVALYEWYDNKGQFHQSTTSIPLSVVNTGPNSSNTLTIPTLRLTEKENVMIGVYRTVSGGTIFYRVGSKLFGLFNNPAVNTINVTDNKSDTDLLGGNLLYTNGGVVDNAQAEATSILTTFKGRIAYVPSENPYSWNYSKVTVNGQPVEFYDQQANQVDQRGGKITALGAMDDKLVLFKESAIFFVTGDGPDDTGAQNDFSTPQLITTDGGCENESSVVSMPIGLMYKSKKGIYLLDRGLNVQYIGKDVEAYNDDTILSSTLVANKNQVRFALDTGVAIVYDYSVNQWYTFTQHDLMVDTISYGGIFTYIRSDGYVYQENDSFSDNGIYIKMKLKTGWFSIGGIQGFQRVYSVMVLGNYVTPHTLRLALSYDFNNVEVYDTLIDAEDLLATAKYGDTSPYGADAIYGGAFPLYQFEYDLPRQKCESIQITIEDIQTEEIGEGYQMSSLIFELGIKQGLDKIGSTRKFN